MPEAPELAYSRDRLKKLIEGRNILELSPGISGRYSKKLPNGMENLISIMNGAPALIEEVGTKGKFMWWRIQVPGDLDIHFAHITYGMSGAWQTNPTKHTAFVVEYGTSKVTRDSQYLYFNDPRHFGTIKFIKGKKEHEKKLKTLGPCVLNENITPEIFAKNLLKKPDRVISESFLDQSLLSGVGNYLRAEILYRSGISPWRCVTDITAEEYVKLCNDTIDISKESYQSQGATISTYRTVDGSKGTTQFNFKVYSRNTCPLGHLIHRQAGNEGRTVWWCNVCQK